MVSADIACLVLAAVCAPPEALAAWPQPAHVHVMVLELVKKVCLIVHKQINGLIPEDARLAEEGRECHIAEMVSHHSSNAAMAAAEDACVLLSENQH